MKVFRSSLHLNSGCEEVSFMNQIFLQDSDLFSIYFFVPARVCVVGNNTSVCVLCVCPSFGAQGIFKRCHSSDDSINWNTVEEIWMERCRA